MVNGRAGGRRKGRKNNKAGWFPIPPRVFLRIPVSPGTTFLFYFLPAMPFLIAFTTPSLDASLIVSSMPFLS